MKHILFTMLLIGSIASSHAQFKDSSIQVRDRFWGFGFRQLDRKLSFGEASTLMQPNREAFALVRRSRTNYTWYWVLAFPGGGLLGYTLAEVTSGVPNPHWHWMAVGAGLSTLSTVLYFKSRRQAQQAADAYNQRFGSKGSASVEIRLGITGNGVGVVMGF